MAPKAAKKATKKGVLSRIKKQHSLSKTITLGGKNYLVSKDDAKQIFEAARPAGMKGNSTYDKLEKATMAYIRKKYKFTDAADAYLRSLVAKAAAAQGKRTKAKK